MARSSTGSRSGYCLTAVCCRRANKFWSALEGGRSVPWRPCSAPPASRELSDRKASFVKRLVYVFASALVMTFLLPIAGEVLALAPRRRRRRRARPPINCSGRSVRPGYFDRRNGLGRRARQSSASASYDAVKDREKKRRREKKEIPPKGTSSSACRPRSSMPNAPRKSTPNGVASDEVKLHLLQGGAKEIVDFKVKRTSIKKIEYFEDLLLEECDRLVAAARLCAGVRVLPCGCRLATRAGRARRPRQSRAVRRGEPGLDRRRRRARAEALARAAGPKARLPGPARPDRRGLRQADRAGISAGPLRAGRRVLHELEELVPEHILVKHDARAVHQQGDQIASRSRSRRRPPSGSTPSPKRCGSGRASRAPSRFTTRRSAKNRRSRWR